MRAPWRTFAVLILALVGSLAATGDVAMAAGADLTGRMAPEMVFTDGMNGLVRGNALSQLRGKVVWVKFVLRDCPLCRQTLPRAQRLYERWGRSGLVVVVVMYKYGPRDIGNFMRQNGYSMPVGTDGDRSIGKRYGVTHYPTDYVIGIDGRVKSSNSAPDNVILTELGHYRLSRLGNVPTELQSVRDAVWNWDYGTALRTAEAAAQKPDASPEVRAAAGRVREQARAELGARVAVAQGYERRRDRRTARTIYDRVVEHFQGTSLQDEAVQARQAFLTRGGG